MLARIATAAVVRRVPQATPIAARFYSENSFNKKEKAHEDQYARHHEAEQLKKLKAAIEKKKAELAELEKAHEEATKQK